MNPSSPFTSGVTRRGRGASAQRQDMAREAPSSDDPRPSEPHLQQPARTPPNPPHRGEGLSRFADRDRARPSVVRRAGRLRDEPTFTEAKLWKRLRECAVRFRRQAPIGPYVVDFACHRAGLVIEIDGGVHNLPDVAVRDLKKDAWLSAQGYRVLRFTTKQVEDDIESVLSAIRVASPLPLDGEGVGGWGGGTTPQDMAREAPAPSGRQPAPGSFKPSPAAGKGFDNHLPPDVNHQGGRALWRARDQWVRDDEN